MSQGRESEESPKRVRGSESEEESQDTHVLEAKKRWVSWFFFIS
jgi:hypothetical protein